MADSKRPKPADEGAVTKRWRPGQDMNETALMPAVAPPPSRRATLTMGAVPPGATPDPFEEKTVRTATLKPGQQPPDLPAPPSSTKLPNSPATLPPPTVHMAADPITHDAGAGVELVIVEEAQIAGGEKKAWRAAEVWTKRRVYGLDSTFKCVEIIDRETGLPERGHEMLGARLGGGRQRDRDNKVRFSYPLPLPGMEAMFMKQKKHGYTSAVERMVVRVRVLVTSAEEALPSWDEIASRWSEPPPK